MSVRSGGYVDPQYDSGVLLNPLCSLALHSLCYIPGSRVVGKGHELFAGCMNRGRFEGTILLCMIRRATYPLVHSTQARKALEGKMALLYTYSTKGPKSDIIRYYTKKKKKRWLGQRLLLTGTEYMIILRPKFNDIIQLFKPTKAKATVCRSIYTYHDHHYYWPTQTPNLAARDT